MKSSRTGKVMALSFGQGVTSVTAIVIAMIMSRVLLEVELATFRQTLLVYKIAMPLLALGLGQAIYYFLPTENRRVRGIVMDGVVVLSAMALCYAAFMFFGGNQYLARRFSNPALAETLVYLVPLIVVALPATLLTPVMVVREKVPRLMRYHVLTGLLAGVIVIFACLFWRTPQAMVLAKVIVGIGVALVGIYLMLHATPQDSAKPSWQHMQKMVGFSVPLMLAGTLGTISLMLDKVIVSVMRTPEEFAVYSNGAIEIPMIAIITGSIMAVILPDLRKAASEQNHAVAIALFRQAALKSGCILIPLMFFLMSKADAFIVTLFSERYSESTLPFRLYLLVLPLRIVFFGAFITAYGETRIILYRSAIGLLANAILSVLLVGALGYIGAVWGTIISLYGVELPWNILTIRRLASCRSRDVLPLGKLSVLGAVSAISVLPALIAQRALAIPVPLFALMIGAGIYLVSFMALVYVLRIQWLLNEMKSFALWCVQLISRFRMR